MKLLKRAMGDGDASVRVAAASIMFILFLYGFILAPQGSFIIILCALLPYFRSNYAVVKWRQTSGPTGRISLNLSCGASASFQGRAAQTNHARRYPAVLGAT